MRNVAIIGSILTLLLSACGSSEPLFPFSPELTVPTNLTATPGNARAILRWDPTPEAASYIVFYYKNPDDVHAAEVSSTPATLGNLTNGTMYYVQVAAVDDRQRMSGKSGVLQVTPDSAIGPDETETVDDVQ